MRRLIALLEDVDSPPDDNMNRWEEKEFMGSAQAFRAALRRFRHLNAEEHEGIFGRSKKQKSRLAQSLSDVKYRYSEMLSAAKAFTDDQKRAKALANLNRLVTSLGIHADPNPSGGWRLNIS